MAISYLNHSMSLEGQRVLARFDFNVPLTEEGKIADPTRIERALPTLKLIEELGAKHIIMCSHLGRPQGKRVNSLGLSPVGLYLAERLQCEVFLTDSCTGPSVSSLIQMPKTKYILLENLRFHEEETKNDPSFSKALASYADVYVNDAFGTCHRKHASTYGVVHYFPKKSYGGPLLKKEVESLGKIANSPKTPFVACIGGAKVSDKLGLLQRLLPQVQNICIGGAMAYPFLKAKGVQVGKSLCSESDVKLAKDLLIQDRGHKIILPIDHLCAKTTEETGEVVPDQNIPNDLMGLDIGPKTIESFSQVVTKASTLFWNGPMGLFEKTPFSEGTFSLARAIAKSSSYSVVGGGDSVRAINESGLQDQFDHISTGGGAALELIEKGDLPGLFALKFGLPSPS